MRGCITNIIVLAVTLFLASCSVGSKLDQNLAEMRAMNKNMEAMNQNMANGINQFADVGQSVKTLSDEAVIFLKKTDPQQYFDMFDKISNKFEEMLAGLLDQTGDIKTFVEQANEATGLFLKYSQALTPEDMVSVKESLDKIAGMTTTMNDLMAKSGNYEAMANQMFMTMQIFTAMGLSLGQSLDVMDPSDTEAMMAALDANIKNMDLASSTGKMALQMQEMSKKMIGKKKNNKLTKLIDGLLTKVIPSIENLSHMWSTKDSNGKPAKALNLQLEDWDKEYKGIFCLAFGFVDMLGQTSPNLEGDAPWDSNDDSEEVDNMKTALHNKFIAKCPDYKNVIVDLLNN